jgi:hypothetical protein
VNNYYEKVVASTENILTVLDRLGDFALRISRREYCHEQQTSRSRMNDSEIGYPQAMPHKRGFESAQAPVAGRS